MSLSARQRQYLKGLGHGLKPVIQIGKEGLTENVIASASKALDDHELIKVGLLDTAGIEKKEAAESLAKSLNADLVQLLGFKITLYRARKKDRKIKLPSE